MNKKLVALLLAGVLAFAGVAAVVVYAQGAEQRAYGEAELTSVLVVTQEVPAGSPATDLTDSVAMTQVPQSVVAEGAVSDLTALGSEVTNAALVPGEQVVAARFGTQAKKADPAAVPKGMQTIDLILSAPRVPEATAPGDVVGVLASYPASDGGPGQSRMVLSKVRIVGVAADVAATVDPALPGATGVRVTFAVTTRQAETVANAAEFGTLWLTAQDEDTDTSGSRKTNAEGVLG